MNKQTILECMKQLCSGCRAGFPLDGKMHIEKEKWEIKTVCDAYPLLKLLNDEEDLSKTVLESLYRTKMFVEAMMVTDNVASGILTTEKNIQQIIDWLEGKADSPVIGFKIPEVIIGCTPGRCR